MLLLPTLTYSRKILQYTICVLKTKQNTKMEAKKTNIYTYWRDYRHRLFFFLIFNFKYSWRTIGFKRTTQWLHIIYITKRSPQVGAVAVCPYTVLTVLWTVTPALYFSSPWLTRDCKFRPLLTYFNFSHLLSSGNHSLFSVFMSLFLFFYLVFLDSS